MKCWIDMNWKREQILIFITVYIYIDLYCRLCWKMWNRIFKYKTEKYDKFNIIKFRMYILNCIL